MKKIKKEIQLKTWTNVPQPLPRKINFFEVKDEFGEFCNYALFPFVDNKKQEWSTSEHYYQAHKFIQDPEYMQIINKANTPHKSKVLGQLKVIHPVRYEWQKELNKLIENALLRGVFIRLDWDEVKENVMMTALEYKFSQYPILKELLLATDSCELCEASPWDSYWGSGKDGQGKNRLGHLLVELREKLMHENALLL